MADGSVRPRAGLNHLDGTLDYTFPRMQADLDYIVEGTESLTAPNWQPHATNPGEPGGEVTAPVGLDNHDNLFLRLKVSDE